MLLVCGANGNLGGRVVAALQRSVGRSGFIAGTRDPGSPFAQSLARSGVQVRRVDYDDPAGLPQAFVGVEAVLIISTYADNSRRLQQHLNVIEAARAAGVRRLVYTSFLDAGPDALSEHSRLVHYPTEQALIQSGLEYTILRHALYADLFINDLALTLETGVLRRASGTAACAYIARDDLGVSAAAVLANEGHENRIYTETMLQTVTGHEVARTIGEVFGREVRYEAVAAEDWPAFMERHYGVPLHLARSAVGTMRAIESGAFDVATADYERIVGRRPQTLKEFLLAHREAAALRQ